MFKRAYLEITNVCNRACSFCPGCRREKSFISVTDFERYAHELRAYTEYLYLHVMGEPTLHPQLGEILSVCKRLEAKVILTTNGTLLRERGELLLSASCLFKVNISLHSFEANGSYGERYIADCIDFAGKASAKGIITVLRLWNKDGRQRGLNSENEEILSKLREELPGVWSENARGYCISPKLFLEYDERFVWPSTDGEELRSGGRCRALIDQIAVLCDGTVVPCCLDGQGKMPLGNLNETPLSEILLREKPVKMKNGFLCGGEFYDPFCRTCGFADRFAKNKD